MLEAEITELDPRYALTNGDTAFSRLVAAGLTAVDTVSMEPRMDLAVKIEMVDPLTWVATLRDDAKFPDGSPVTAADVEYTFRSALDPAMKAVNRRMLGERFAGPEAIEVIDALHVRFRLRQPLATFLSDLDFGIVSKAACEAVGGRLANGFVVGAGPFQVEAITSTEVRLTRNPHYYGAAPPMGRVVGRTVRDANARLLMLAGGSADLGHRDAALADAAFGIRERTLEQRDQIVLADRLEAQHARARQERGVDLERRVLRRGADEDHRAGLDVRQERVLLALVEAVDLVDEEHRALAALVQRRPREVERLAQLLHAAEHGRHRGELRADPRREQARERRLAGPRRAPQDQRRQVAGRERALEQLAGREQVALAHDLLDRARPHALGERLAALLLLGRVGEQLHRPRSLR